MNNKKSTRRKVLLLFFTFSLTLYVNNLFGQIHNPVSWKFTNEKVASKEYILTFTANIEGDWHMYGLDLPEGGPIATSFTFEPSDSYELVGDIEVKTKPEIKFDNSFQMELQLFGKKAVFAQKIKLLSEVVTINGFIEFMSCNDESCLPPKEEDFSIKIGGGSENTASDESQTIGKAPSVNPISFGTTDDKVEEPAIELTDNSETLENSLGGTESKKERSLLGLFFFAFGLGLASILTPCVYPIIPLTVSFFMRGDKSKSTAIFNAISFGVSIMLIYTVLGLIVGITQVDIPGLIAKNWIANLIFFLIFIVFAISFFGVFEIMLPTGMQNKIDQKADKGGFLAPFFMALATVIISFSCTGPIATVVLGYATDGEIITPTFAMFGYGLAFALPFTFLAFFPALLKKMPKSGGWLNSVKVVFAFILLAFGLKFLSIIDQYFHWNFLSRDVFLALWIVIFAMLGFYLLGKLKFSHDSELPYLGVSRLLLAIVTFAFVVYMIPGLWGAPLKMIASFLPPETTQEFSISSGAGLSQSQGESTALCGTPKYEDLFHLPHNLEGYYTVEEGIECAKEQNKPILLDFKGHSCSNCKAMEANVWSDPAVLEKLRNDFIIVALYTDDRTKLPEDEWVTSSNDGKVKKTLGKINEDYQISKFGTNAIPLYAVVDHKGNLLTDDHFGYDPDINEFLKYLEEGKSKFKD